MNPRKDFIGNTYKYLRVLHLTKTPEEVKDKTILYYSCQCLFENCGNIIPVAAGNIGRQSTCKSCAAKKRNRTHGLKNHWLYRRWLDMRHRCESPMDESYRRYGGIGVKVCDRWLGRDGFKNFYDDLYAKHPNLDELMELGYTLDRYPNKEGNYEPSNCRYASKKEQANNTKANVIVKHGDTEDTLHKIWEKGVAEGICTITYTCFHTRVRVLGWPIDKALRTPDLNKRNDDLGLRIYERYCSGGVMMKDIAVEFGVSKATVTHWIQVHKAKNAS